MTRPAILRMLDVCDHEKCSRCGGMERVPHENIITVTRVDFSDDVQDGWCEGGPDDFECHGHDEEDALIKEMVEDEING